MKLLELVNPVLLLVIDLRRKVHAGLPLDFGEVRRKADETFDAVDRKAASAAMTDRWNRARIALCYLMDEIAIMEPWAGKGLQIAVWRRFQGGCFDGAGGRARQAPGWSSLRVEPDPLEVWDLRHPELAIRRRR